jgi:hypothetical protein
MKKFILPLAILGIGLLLGAAVAIDCVRLADDARERVQLADAEVAKHETRLVKLLADAPQASPEVTDAIAEYRSARDMSERRAAYEHIVQGFQKTMMPNVDATNPLARKFMDDAAGAINRHEIAEQPFVLEKAAYRAYLGSWRGRIARRFSALARADWRAD